MKKLISASVITCLIIALVSFEALSQVPQVQRANDIAFITGGIGEDEYKDIEAESKHWPLTIQFSQLDARGRGEWISEVEVLLLNSNRVEIFKALSDGPMMMLDLKPGKYELITTYNDSKKKRLVVIGSQRTQKVSIFWK